MPKKIEKNNWKYRLQQGWVARVEISRLDKSLRRLWLALVPFGIKCQLSTFTKYKRTILEIHCRAMFSFVFFFIQVLAIYFEQPQKQEGQWDVNMIQTQCNDKKAKSRAFVVCSHLLINCTTGILRLFLSRCFFRKFIGGWKAAFFVVSRLPWWIVRHKMENLYIPRHVKSSLPP